MITRVEIYQAEVLRGGVFIVPHQSIRGRGLGCSDGRGFTLLELLIGVALSSIILGALSQVYVYAQQNARYQSGLITLSESGHYSLSVMQQAFERAGAQNFSVSGDFMTQLPPVIWSATADGDRFDQVGLQYKTGANGGYTCTGARAKPNTYYFNHYEVIAFSGNPNLMQLVCRSVALPAPHWDATQALAALPRKDTGILVAGVEGFQVVYGVRSRSDEGGAPQRYISADQVRPRQERVVAVRIALLLKTVGEAPVLSRAQARRQPKDFDLLGVGLSGIDGSATGVMDRQLRKVFNASYQLKNVARKVSGLL